MKRPPFFFWLILMALLIVSLTACDDPTTSLVVTYEEADLERQPLRIIVALPDSTTSTASLAYGESITFRSLYEGAYGVKAVIDESYTQGLREKRDALIVQLAAADVLGEQLSSEQRAELSAEIDSLIAQVNETAALSGATACTVAPDSEGNVGIQVIEDVEGFRTVDVIKVYCK